MAVRHARRYKVRWPLRVTQETGGAVFGYTINISYSGMLFTTPIPYALGDLAEVELNVEPNVAFRATIQIVREDGVENGEYLYGARFDNISDEALSILCDGLFGVWKIECEDEAGLTDDIDATEEIRHLLDESLLCH